MLKKILLIVVFYILIFILPINVKAVCDNSKIADLKELASNINISYTYKIEDGKALFDITINNVFDELLLQNERGNRFYNISNNGEIVFTNYKQGSSYRFDVYANGGECNNRYLTTIYAITPDYNKYYNLKICDNAKEYELCQKWVTHNLDYNGFINNVTDYINSRDKIKEDIDNNNISKITYILKFIADYYLYIIGIIVLVVIVVKYIRYKRDTFGF